MSVCVPYWERQAALNCMFANYAQLYPTKKYKKKLRLEFSVCDDGSPVQPAIVPADCIITRLPRKDHPLNPCVPINAAVAASAGPIIVLTNAEVEHRDPVLAEMRALLGTPADRRYVVAACREVESGMWLAGPGVDYTKNGRDPVPPGGHFHFLSMCWRYLWDRAGGFDEDYRNGQACDDNDWLWRLWNVGARFVTTEGVVWHHRGERVKWGLPHNRELLRAKWPQITSGKVVAAQQEDLSRIRAAGVDAVYNSEPEARRSGLLCPRYALILGGGQQVWDEVLAWESIYGRQWDGLVIAANDVGSHWPRHLDHWVSLHPNRLENWARLRTAHGFPEGWETWGRRSKMADHQIQPWAGGASGMLAIQVASVLGCTRAVLCGVPMDDTPHFPESVVHKSTDPWKAVAGHWRAWNRHLDKMMGWVRSMSGRTMEVLGGPPTLDWLLEEEGEVEDDVCT